MDVIGLDIGHSAVKISAGGQHIIFPTAATRAINLALADAAAVAEGMRRFGLFQKRGTV